MACPSRDADIKYREQRVATNSGLSHHLEATRQCHPSHSNPCGNVQSAANRLMTSSTPAGDKVGSVHESAKGLLNKRARVGFWCAWRRGWLVLAMTFAFDLVVRIGRTLFE